MLSLLDTRGQMIAFGAVAGVLVVVTEKVVTPVLRRLPRSEHLGRSGSSSGGVAGYDGGSCDSGGGSC